MKKQNKTMFKFLEENPDTRANLYFSFFFTNLSPMTISQCVSNTYEKL